MHLQRCRWVVGRSESCRLVKGKSGVTTEIAWAATGLSIVEGLCMWSYVVVRLDEK